MSDAPQITPDHPLSLTLSIAQLRTVLEVLATGPFRTVAPLIGEIERQCTMQIGRLQQPPMQRGNGTALNEMPPQQGEARSNVG